MHLNNLATGVLLLSPAPILAGAALAVVPVSRYLAARKLRWVGSRTYVGKSSWVFSSRTSEFEITANYYASESGRRKIKAASHLSDVLALAENSYWLANGHLPRGHRFTMTPESPAAE